MAIAPSQDSIANSCVNAANTTISPQENSDGFVFTRTDKTEYRWIDTEDSCVMKNIWIDEPCADRPAGATESGDWIALIEIAPGIDSLIGPCY